MQGGRWCGEEIAEERCPLILPTCSPFDLPGALVSLGLTAPLHAQTFVNESLLAERIRLHREEQQARQQEEIDDDQTLSDTLDCLDQDRGDPLVVSSGGNSNVNTDTQPDTQGQEVSGASGPCGSHLAYLRTEGFVAGRRRFCLER